MADCRRYFLIILPIVASLPQSCRIADILFCALRDPAHRLHSLDRICAGSALPTEHDRRRAIIDRIGHIRCLRSGRPWILDHRIEHLRRCYDDLSELQCLFNHFLLQNRHFLERDLNSHVTSCHHDPVRNRQDLIQVINPLHILDLGYHLHPAAMLPDQFPDRQHIIRTSHK